MLTLIRWRAARRAGAPAEQVMAAATRRKIATISQIEAVVVVIMVFLGAAIARGYGLLG